MEQKLAPLSHRVRLSDGLGARKAANLNTNGFAFAICVCPEPTFEVVNLETGNTCLDHEDSILVSYVVKPGSAVIEIAEHFAYAVLGHFQYKFEEFSIHFRIGA